MTLQKTAAWARLLAHPARLMILEYLANCNHCISGDISAKLPLAASTVSQHLKELKKVGLIQGSIQGTKIFYCIHKSNWELAQKQLLEFMNGIQVNVERDCK